MWGTVALVTGSSSTKWAGILPSPLLVCLVFTHLYWQHYIAPKASSVLAFAFNTLIVHCSQYLDCFLIAFNKYIVHCIQYLGCWLIAFNTCIADCSGTWTVGSLLSSLRFSRWEWVLPHILLNWNSLSLFTHIFHYRFHFFLTRWTRTHTWIFTFTLIFHSYCKFEYVSLSLFPNQVNPDPYVECDPEVDIDKAQAEEDANYFDEDDLGNYKS